MHTMFQYYVWCISWSAFPCNYNWKLCRKLSAHHKKHPQRAYHWLGLVENSTLIRRVWTTGYDRILFPSCLSSFLKFKPHILCITSPSTNSLRKREAEKWISGLFSRSPYTPRGSTRGKQDENPTKPSSRIDQEKSLIITNGIQHITYKTSWTCLHFKFGSY